MADTALTLGETSEARETWQTLETRDSTTALAGGPASDFWY